MFMVWNKQMLEGVSWWYFVLFFYLIVYSAPTFSSLEMYFSEKRKKETIYFLYLPRITFCNIISYKNPRVSKKARLFSFYKSGNEISLFC